MSGRRRALLDAILERPDDDDLRLVYADALEEDGDGEHAELIRLPAQASRARELERLHGERFVGPVIAEHAEGWTFDRGLVDSLRGVAPLALAEHADEMLGAGPIRSVSLGRVDEDESDEDWEDWAEHTCAAMRKLAACRHLARLETLDMSDGDLGDSDDEGERLALLLESPHLGKLEAIYIGTECSTAAMAAIASAHERLPALRDLRFGAPLGDGRVGDKGAIALGKSPLCARLEVLEIIASGITAKGIKPLAASFRSLRELHLGGSWYVQNPIGPSGARALAASKGLSALVVLDLSGAGIGDDGARALASAPWFGSLRHLDLGDNDLTDATALAIARSGTKSLATLGLGHGGVHPVREHSISDASVDVLFASIPSLEEIRIGPEGGTGRRRP